MTGEGDDTQGKVYHFPTYEVVLKRGQDDPLFAHRAFLNAAKHEIELALDQTDGMVGFDNVRYAMGLIAAGTYLSHAEIYLHRIQTTKEEND